MPSPFLWQTTSMDLHLCFYIHPLEISFSLPGFLPSNVSLSLRQAQDSGWHIKRSGSGRQASLPCRMKILVICPFTVSARSHLFETEVMTRHRSGDLRQWCEKINILEMNRNSSGRKFILTLVRVFVPFYKSYERMKIAFFISKILRIEGLRD